MVRHDPDVELEVAQLARRVQLLQTDHQDFDESRTPVDNQFEEVDVNPLPLPISGKDPYTSSGRGGTLRVDV